MNSIIVWVMMSYAHGWFPTLEFKTEEKCLAAANHIKKDYDSKHSMSNMMQPYCVKVEK